MEIKSDLLHHFKQLQESLTGVERATASVDVATFIAEVRIDARVYKLYPMFLTTIEGRTTYAVQFSAAAWRFGGWRPYPGRVTPDVGRKLLFKKLLARHQLPTPEYSVDSRCALRDVLVKLDISSFGSDLRGPFKSARSIKLNVDKGEFVEQFISGEILKIWFYRVEPICMEIKPMPVVIGDGRSTIRDLAEKRRFRADNAAHWKCVEEVLAYFDRRLDERLPLGERQLIDYRYTTAFVSPQETRDVHLATDPTQRKDILFAVGDVIGRSLPDEWRGDALYSVDAIRDTRGKLWFLEANFNPFIHPFLYPTMIRGLGYFDPSDRIHCLAANASS